jgi:putative ABC transport system permease protein
LAQLPSASLTHGIFCCCCCCCCNSCAVQGLFFHTLGIVLLAAGCTMGYGLALVIGVSPWWSPQYLIPVLGMVLGNTISGISVGLAAVMEELTTGGSTGTAVGTAGTVSDGCTQCEAQKLNAQL